MNKKIWIGSLLAVFMLVAISFVSSAEMNTGVEQKESPLWGIRTRRATTEKISKIIENIKTKFLGNRMFFIPFSSLLRGNDLYSGRAIFVTKDVDCSDDCEYTNLWSYGTCQPTCAYVNGQTLCSGCTSDGNCWVTIQNAGRTCDFGKFCDE